MKTLQEASAIMKFPRRRFLQLAAAAAGLPGVSRIARAQSYPDKPVRVIVPFAPGGPTDVFARLVSQKLSEHLGKQFFVENIVGAGGNVGAGRAAQAAPDGYTLLVNGANHVVNPTLYDHVPYDPAKDFEPVTIAVTAPAVLTIHPSLPARTVKELVALIKANPGKYSYASPGTGTPPQLVGELFRLTLGLDLVHVPFNGGGPAIASAAAGHTPISFGSMAPAVALVKDGKLRALAVATKTRSQALPDVPTMAEAGYPEIEGNSWFAVMLPAGAPREIVDLLNREIVKSLALPDMKERLAALGYEPVGNTPEESAAQFKTDMEKWAKVIKAAGIKAR
ncbi:MAG: tripartite tricarboxylate transporter substrate binding protein [Xanthobacteraceae bacterium]